MKKLKNCVFFSVFNINIILQIVLFCCLFCYLSVNNVFALEQLSNDQIITAQNNGVISAMCYVLDIITGNVMRAIFGVFIVGTGWMFLLGGIKDWKPILFMTLAIGFILGGEELANLISGNTYSCKKLYEIAEINKETINNGGDCYVSEIDIYFPGQKWYKCSSFNTSVCEELITDDTIINDGDTISLKTCETGSFKDDENINLKYICNKTRKAFVPSESNDIRAGMCKEACLATDLTKLINAFGAVNPTNKSNTYKILNDSGSYKQNKYFTQGTIVDLDCKSGYVEYDADSNVNANGIKATCASNATFDITGSCKQKCKLSSSTYSSQVSTWQKYSKTTDSWGDTTDTEFYYGEKIRIKECDENKGYFFPISTDIEGNEIPIKDEEKTVLTCGENGSWKKEDNGNTLICSKNCDVRKYQYYSSNSWNICNLNDVCSEPLTDKFSFQSDESLEVNECLNDEYSIFSSKDVSKLRIACSNGKWVENGGERCLKKCNVGTIKNYEFVDRWIVCERTGRCFGIDKVDTINSGEIIKQNICKENYFIDSNEATEYLCKNGKFTRKTGTTEEVCRMSCLFNELANFDQKALIWKRVNSNGSTHTSENIVNLDNIGLLNTSASYGDYYAIQTCRDNDNFKTFDNTPIIVKCDEGGKWAVYKNKDNVCFPKCNFSIIEQVKEWGVYSAISQSYRKATEDEKTGGIINGTKIQPLSCEDGTTLNPSLGGSFYIQCKNSELIKSQNVDICYKDCHVSQLGLNVITNVKEFVNLTTTKIIDKNSSVLKHDEEIGISICADGFNLQNTRAVFVCKNGTLNMLANNDPVEVCKKINN